ncbi:hypothetical protein CYLTODRAFT_489108 [Cylindrobasidium torrendii FP15055 ss-10]|uniref:Uncharacterized protein n=1 Tax=Cylindrobasidium torrendii FP15055 ss-10 TaxID=1314674 RepID=A0A0D7BHV6_9AGAR|nr:hypothetical protein CYLTODRAFT_489108 [Cylindrobasidium torrendii FP15055 ss-10]
MADSPPSYVSSDPWGDVDYGAVHAARRHAREHDESAPLIPGHPKSGRPTKTVCFLFATILAAFLTAVIAIPVHISSDHNTAASIDRRHRVELRRLNATHGAELYNLTEQYEHQIHWRQVQMDQMVAAHDRELEEVREAYEQRLRDGDMKMERVVAAHERQLKEVRSAYEQRLRDGDMKMDRLVAVHERQLKEVRSAYEQQLEAKDRWVENQKHLLFARESAVHDAETRIGNDAERRKKANLYWEQPPKRGRVCTGWKTLPYVAELYNVPQDVDGVAWCQGTALHMPGMEDIDKPEWCEQTENGKIVAHWTHRESANCHTLWGRQKDQGCQAGSPGYRLVEMQLLNHHQPYDSWLEMCETTPWGDHGRTPDVCEHRGNGGIWGKWVVHDMKCEKVTANEELDKSFML